MQGEEPFNPHLGTWPWEAMGFQSWDHQTDLRQRKGNFLPSAWPPSSRRPHLKKASESQVTDVGLQGKLQLCLSLLLAPGPGGCALGGCREPRVRQRLWGVGGGTDTCLLIWSTGRPGQRWAGLGRALRVPPYSSKHMYTSTELCPLLVVQGSI